MSWEGWLDEPFGSKAKMSSSIISPAIRRITVLMTICVVVLADVDVDPKPEVVYLWPLPNEISHGNSTISVDPDLSVVVAGSGGNSSVLKQAFHRYRAIIFPAHRSHHHHPTTTAAYQYDISQLKITVDSPDETLNLGVDESYSLYVSKRDDHSIVGQASIQANTVYGALRALETFSQLCTFSYKTRTVEVYEAPWYIQDEPSFPFRGLLLDTSRHYLPINVIKQVIESMSYAKLNVLHWHIIDEESFPLEVPSYANLWEGSYSKWERYTVEDAYDIVDFAKMRGVNVMAEIDVPGHAESWGIGYPDLWPSQTCREPLDVTKNITFDVISGILTDLRKIFPFELFHLGGDEVHTDCWNSTPHVKQWLQDRNMTAKGAYQYFVLRTQEIAIAKSWTPVNWEETFNSFSENLSPRTVIHNWLGGGVCPKAVAKGFKCIFSNQGVWYLDHLDVPWESFYDSDPLQGITDPSEKKLVLGGEVCMWGETADASDVQQTIWPRAAAASDVDVRASPTVAEVSVEELYSDMAVEKGEPTALASSGTEQGSLSCLRCLMIWLPMFCLCFNSLHFFCCSQRLLG